MLGNKYYDEQPKGFIMKYLILLIMIILLSGCGGTVTSEQIEMSEFVCKDNGGVDYIMPRSPPFHPITTVKCNNLNSVMLYNTAYVMGYGRTEK